MNPTLTIRSATSADSIRLSAFASGIFRDTFGPANNPSDLELYLGTTFTVERQAAEIADPNGVVLLVEMIDAGGQPHLAGYAHVLNGEPPASVTGSAPIELSRFYVARDWQGRGIAQSLMQAVVETSLERGARTLWLGVWEHNPRAIAFYRKHGFREVGEKSFLLGTDLQNDLIFSCDLESAAAEHQ